METFIQEEEILKKRLEELEKRYKEALFSEDSVVKDVEEKIIESTKESEEVKPINFKSLENWKIDNLESSKELFKEPPSIVPKSLDLPVIDKPKEINEEKIGEKKEEKREEKKEVNIGVKKEEKRGEEIVWPKKIVQGESKIVLEPEIKPGLEIKKELRLIPDLIPKKQILKKEEIRIKNEIKEIEKKEEKKEVEKIEEKKEVEKSETVKKLSDKSWEDNRPKGEEIKKCAEKIKSIKKEISKILMGQEEIVEGLIMGLICNAHVLVEGVPGIAKTLAVRALASVIGCEVKRVQFTVDLLPTDIIGITTYTPDKGFEVLKGPIFANFLIADEINRAPPKTQSALIEGMQEKQVSIGRERFVLPTPFFVMATENPIENAGVYPLPEAQIDRFLFKLIMGYPKEEEEKKVLETNITTENFESFNLKAVLSPKEIIEMQEIVKRVYVDDSVKNYILAIVRKTRDRDFSMAEFISYGSSPRASIGLFIASKAQALMDGRNYVIPEDVKKVAFNVLRHRLILSYKANIKKISEDAIVKDILNSVKVE